MLEDWAGQMELRPEVVAGLCHRRVGVGADGLIGVASPEVAAAAGVPDTGSADLFMDYRNADGSVAEMCGNGVRCLARLAFERGLVTGTELVVATRSGPKRVWLDVDGTTHEVRSVRVDMGRPGFALSEIPMAGPPDGTFLAEALDHGGVT